MVHLGQPNALQIDGVPVDCDGQVLLTSQVDHDLERMPARVGRYGEACVDQRKGVGVDLDLSKIRCPRVESPAPGKGVSELRPLMARPRPPRRSRQRIKALVYRTLQTESRSG
jgi:hypothetical protein